MHKTSKLKSNYTESNNKNKYKFALFGYPLIHSLSPIIHQEFARQFNLDISYEKIESEELPDFQSLALDGANVTMPLKHRAYSICKKVTERAESAQSVNTLYWQDNIICGDSTDGVGFIRDLTQNLKQSLYNKEILILGAGGAASALIESIQQQNPKSITLSNRTIQKADTLAKRFNGIEVCSFDALCKSYDWVINCTPSTALVNCSPVEGSCIYELSYAQNLPFSRWAKDHGAKEVFTGIGMLVEQAAESFRIWTGFFPSTQELPIHLKQIQAKTA